MLMLCYLPTAIHGYSYVLSYGCVSYRLYEYNMLDGVTLSVLEYCTWNLDVLDFNAWCVFR